MYLYKITGTGKYFGPFYVAADTLRSAFAHASDILAGADSEGRRYYRVAEHEIVSIVKTDIKV